MGTHLSFILVLAALAVGCADIPESTSDESSPQEIQLELNDQKPPQIQAQHWNRSTNSGDDDALFGVGRDDIGFVWGKGFTPFGKYTVWLRSIGANGLQQEWEAHTKQTITDSKDP